MHELFVIDKDDERRRLHSHLRDVVELEPPALVRRRSLQCDGLRHDLIENAGRDPPLLVLKDHVDGRKELAEPLARFRGNEDNLRVAQVREDLTYLLLIVPRALRVLVLHGIPFVDGDDNALASLVRNSGNLRILL